MGRKEQLSLRSLQYLNDVGKVLPLDVVVCLDEDFTQNGLADGVVLCIELVESVEGVTVLWIWRKLLLYTSYVA